MKKENVWILFCMICCLFFVLFQGGKLAFMLFIITTVLCVYLFLCGFSGLSGTKGTRTIENVKPAKTVPAGSALQVHFQFRFPGFWPFLYVIIKDELIRHNGERDSYEMSLVPSWKRKGYISYQTSALGRGRYSFGSTALSTGDIFNLFQHQSEIHLPFSFYVFPETVHISEWKTFEQSYKGKYTYLHSNGMLRETNQINGIREYVDGDKLSRVHWKATAKTGHWKSIEYTKESQSQMLVLLDCNAASYVNDDQFELAVSIAASILEYAQGQNIPTGLLASAKKTVYFYPGQGLAHKIKLMYQLSSVEADGSKNLLEAVRSKRNPVSPGSLIVIVSPNHTEQLFSAVSWMQRNHFQAYHIWACAKPPSSFAEQSWNRRLKKCSSMGYAVDDLQAFPLKLKGRQI